MSAQLKKRRPKIVVIGGGTGLPVILKGLRNKDVDITAIVTVADDGGSSGILRNYINVVPPGDIRNVLVALSQWPELQLDIFQYRFDSSDQFFAGHAIGNLIIAALAEMKSGIFEAVQELSEMMQVNGHVYPAANEPLVLNAEFKDGTKLKGESEITAAHKAIKRVWVTPSNYQDGHATKAVPEVIDAIMNADQIVLGPGSLFTSILPNLMIENVGAAVCATSAEVIYICNIMTQKGETDQFTDADHVRILNRHLGQNFVDTVLVNSQPVPNDYMDFQRWNELSQPVQHDFAGLREQGARVISTNFLQLKDNGAFHDSDKVVAELMNRLQQARD
ncbi:gluconeogenesis factor YvcK family protein [Paucilactobacillus kaifaensis]|uniref:gluconeogenesis factor YvcK family protein n=1 Tax=Paucilactobacillus kaifaensis TaxID=2559921 RepID=UPI0010F4D93F|nr:YvcK family protein [Paucilactobacillus kaifaensis]